MFAKNAFLMVLTVGLLAAAGPVQATDYYWNTTGASGSDTWSTAGNWDPTSGPPNSSSDNVYIANGDICSLNSTKSRPRRRYRQCRHRHPRHRRTRLVLQREPLDRLVVHRGRPQWRWYGHPSGGNMSVVGDTFFGYRSGATGTYNLSGGTLSIASGKNLWIGYGGTAAAMTVNNATLIASNAVCVGGNGAATLPAPSPSRAPVRLPAADTWSSALLKMPALVL